ncbi:MAG: permease [Gemmatimonadetes bacterium]|nr:permease [Gemmatimonadota bacterium]
MSPFRYAARSLTRARGFAVATIATIALGVGAGCAVFSVVNAVLLRPLPYPNSDRLVGLWHTMPGLGLPRVKQALGTYAVYRESAKSFEQLGVSISLAATLSYHTPNLPAERGHVGYMTASMFSTLGARPLVGRVLLESDEKPGAERVAVISERLWHTRFNGDARVLDQRIDIDGAPRRIVGVMPEAFTYPESSTPVWLPLDPSPGGYVGGFAYAGVALLRPGVTPEMAQRELAQLLTRVAERFPEARPGVSTTQTLAQTQLAPVIHPMRDDVIGSFDRVLWLIAATVVVLLAVAFSNVASLLLVRLESRQRELAVRSAFGASQWEMAASLFAETAIVSAIGGALGLVVAAAALRVLVVAGPLDIPRLAEVHVDTSLALSAIALSALFAAVSVAIAATRVRSRDAMRLLRDAGRTGTAGRTSQRMRAAFVGIEVALSLVLLAGSGVLARSVVKLRAVQPGFDASNLFTFWTFLPPGSYKRREDAARFYGDAIERMRQIPGVVSVAATAKLPLEVEGFAYQVLIWADDGTSATNKLPPVYQATTATRGYFDTMRIPVLAGRSFDDANVRRGALEAVASRGFVEHFWHDATGRSGVGKRLRPTASGPWFTIVGVVDDIRDSTLTRSPVPGVYFPEEANGDTTGGAFTTARDMAFVVRTRAPAPGIASTLAHELHALDPNLPFYRAATMEQIVTDARSRTTFVLMLLTAGAVATLLLGVVGLYGVIAYAVSLRTREIGIRIALGLTPAGAARMILTQGELIIVGGAVAGLGVFLLFATLLESVTFEVQAMDATAMGGAMAAVLVVASVATWIPARRAARVDPAEALRAE